MPQKESKVRADRLLYARGLAESREQAQALIMAGAVFAPAGRVLKPGAALPENTPLELRGRLPYVSRGGLKLAGALDAFGLDVAGRIALDVGAATGGFADCLLQRGAQRVYAVDVGHGHTAAGRPELCALFAALGYINIAGRDFCIGAAIIGGAAP